MRHIPPDYSGVPSGEFLCCEGMPIPIEEMALTGDLLVPDHAKGIILFAHGSGSGRYSPRNRYVASVLNRHGFGTLLTDLLTQEEEETDQKTAHLRFDIPLLAERLSGITDWTQQNSGTKFLPLGYFGSSTGAAAALISAARYPGITSAVVSRGGRPDLAGEFLSRVSAPVLLIVGEYDEMVHGLNRQALEKLNGESILEIVPGATHLCEEPEALEMSAHLASAWFERYLLPARFYS